MIDAVSFFFAASFGWAFAGLVGAVVNCAVLFGLIQLWG